jgi:anti-anti-sigma factor
MAEKLNVLLVEDFDITRKMEIKILNDLGFDTVISARNGKDAIERLETEADIGLIISDWNMPEMNGYEFLLQVRASKKYRDIPFIMATAQGEKAQIQKAIRDGASQFITKPFTSQELGAIIKDIFEPKPAEHDRPPRNPAKGKKADITVAHIQITDHLALGILKHLIRTEQAAPKYFELKTRCMSGWNPVQNALEKGEADAAFILAPLAMDLFSFGTPIKLVLFAHKNGSICVRSRRESPQPLREFLKSKVFYLPHTLSVHHVLADMFLSEIGLKLGPVGKTGADVFFEVLPPVKMPNFLKENPDACGFVVAEPLGTMAIHEGISDLMFFSGELWQNHPCCVLAMREDFIEMHADAAYEFIQLLTEAGKFISQKPGIAARVALRFLDPDEKLGLTGPVLESVLTQPGGIKTDDLFPVIEDLDRIQRYMKEKMGMGTIIDLEKFVDTRFAEAACGSARTDISSVIHGTGKILANMIRRQIARKPPEVVEKKESESVFEITKEKTSLHFRISADPNLIRRVIHETTLFIIRLGFREFSGLNLILQELMSNAAEHGNRGDKKRKIFCSVVQIQGALFKLTVADEGQGFDYRKLDMTMPEDKFQIRRRGYPFISAFSEKIEFSDKGNQVSVWHRICEETCFETCTADGWLIICPSGNIAAPEIDQFRTLLKTKLEQGHLKYRFDFSDVQDIDSSGISAFVILSRVLEKRNAGAGLEIVNVPPAIANLFRMTRLNKICRITEKK